MKQVKWFDRKFDFKNQDVSFLSLLERLRGAPVRLEEKINSIAKSSLTIKVDNTWSIQENAGHLLDLEPLWQGRLQDIINHEEYLRVADLQNRKTDEANHNAKNVADILRQFRTTRNETITSLEKLDDHQMESSALHPRLKTPMRIVDLFLFVAEHDDHHLARIHQLNQYLVHENSNHRSL